MRKGSKWNAVLSCVIAFAMVAGLVPAPALAEAVAEAGEAFAEGVSPDGVGTAEGGEAASAQEAEAAAESEGAESVEAPEPGQEHEVPDPATGAESGEGGSGEEAGASSEEREAAERELIERQEAEETEVGRQEEDERAGAGERGESERAEAGEREGSASDSSTKDAPEAAEASNEPKEPEVRESSAIAADPRVAPDSSMDSGQVTTWDCVWLGSYPQAEVTASDPEYAILVNTTFDSKGDATVGGQRYRRISRNDVTDDYYWEDDGYGSATYRYFRWEPIKWRVLEVNGNNALVVADVALDDQCCNANYADVTWETSSVRSWLNGYGAEANQPGTDYASRNFYGTAFSTSEERSAVLQSTVANADNQDYGTPGGNDTTDRVFLLALSDVYGDDGARHGFANDWDTWDEARRCRASDYARAMGAYLYNNGGTDNCWWWLRSPGADQYSAAGVDDGGYVNRYGDFVFVYGDGGCDAIRPALNLNLESPAVTSAGTVSSNGDVDETAAPGTGGTLDDPVRITALALEELYYAWDGTAKEPGVTVTAGGEVVPPSGYDVAYRNNVNVGTATVTVTGRDGYTGTLEATFTIASASSSIAANPRVAPDSSMESGQVTTWDCVWLGSYPQAEVTASDAEYNSVVHAVYDDNGDATVGGQRYRRISKDDATYSYYWSSDGYGSAEYRYFRFEPIKWRVLEVSGSNALVVADVALDHQRYNTNYTDVTWETSSVRSWLNGYGAGSNQPGVDYASRNFYNSAFATSEERSAILQSTVANADNQYYGTSGGSDTTDRVFLLSESEADGDGGARHGFSGDPDASDEARRCRASDYAHAMGAYRSADSGYEDNCSWWLRSPVICRDHAAFVIFDGGVYYYFGTDVRSDYAIRPALNLNLASPAVTSAGTVSSNGTADETASPGTGAAEEPVRITSLALDQTFYAWDGTAKRPAVIVTAGDELVPPSGYDVAYKNNVNVGTATVTVTGKDGYTGTLEVTFTIAKAANTMTAQAAKASLSATYNAGAATATTANVTVANAVGAVTYTNASDDPAKGFSVNKTSGKVTLPKATKAGTYAVKVRATAAGNVNYNSKSVTVSYKVVVGKAANPMTAHAAKASFSATYNAAAATATAANVTVANAVGAVTYTNASDDATAKGFSVNKTSGKVTLPKATKVGTYAVKVRATAAGNANYNSKSVTVSYKVVVGKAANPMTAKATKATVSAKYNASKAVVTASNLAVSKAQGKVTYANASSDATAKGFSVNKTSGKVTLRKATKAETYAVKVRATAAGNANYKSKSVTVAYKVAVGKADNPMTAKATKATVSAKYNASKAVVTASNVAVSKAQGAVTYANASSETTAKKFVVNKTSGKVTVPKATKVGTYAVKVKATAAGNANYKAKSVTVSYKVAVVKVANPRVVADSSATSGQVATWDCVWLGSYPQTEVTASDAEYNGVVNAAFDSRGDATVGGRRYRRISKSDATYGYWEDDGYGSETYRYFRYEPIKWRVLEVNGNNALVVADVALDDQCYNTNSTAVTWETSSLRSWLNGYGADSNQPWIDYTGKNFLRTAFSTSEERSAVLQSTVVNASNQFYSYGGEGGNDTRDRVFLLAVSEVVESATHGFANDYYTWDEARRCQVSDYARAMGAHEYEGNCNWWLRSSGYYQGRAAVVYHNGDVDRDGNIVDYGRGVRPALNINLKSRAVKSAGTVSSYGGASVQYHVHRQTYGNEPAWSKSDGEQSGTVGESKRLEAIWVRLGSAPVGGSIKYQTHIQGIGWQGWRSDGDMSGTAGQSRRLEAIRIKLTGDMAKRYDVYYRVHAQRFGWMGWAKNGASAGTAGYSYRLEAIQIVLVPKGGRAPTVSYKGATQQYAEAFAQR